MTGPVSWLKPAERVAKLKPYFFSLIRKRLDELRARGVDIIRLDMGSPDLPPANFIIQELIDSAQQADTHGYTPYGGTEQYRQAIATYYQRRFQVKLDPIHECEGLIGSKEGIYNLSQALLNPGDVSLIPEPGYPTYLSSALIAGAEPYLLPLTAENEFFPDLKDLPSEITRRAKIIWLNYPNNPTGAVADLAFFEKVVGFAHRHQLIVIHDAPYVEIGYDGYQAPSVLQVSGAREVAVELNSLSKSYNMAGWRLGMAVGNAAVIQYLHALKVKIDSFHFGPIQTAGAAALTGDQDWLDARNAIYQARRDAVVAGVNAVGLRANVPKSALYVWAELPAGTDDVQFCEQLVESTGVSLTPGSVFGESGGGYVRISLCTPVPKIDEAMARLAQWVKDSR
jgi:LL-diaminopimelate aminotransferase